MTASERLRALAERAGSKESWFDARLEAVDALPLIADVVEAAEEREDLIRRLALPDLENNPEAPWPREFDENRKAMAAALTALREHLDSGTPDRGEVVGPRGQDSAISAEPPPEYLEGGDDG